MVIAPSCVQSVEMRVSQSGLVGRNCCQTIISASPQSGQKGVASHRKGARNRPCLQLARTRPSALNWSSTWWARWPELRWHLPLAVFELGKQLVSGRVALAIFLDDGLTRLRDSTVFRTTAVPPGDNSRLPCAGRTDSDFLQTIPEHATPVCKPSDSVQAAREALEPERLDQIPASWPAQCCPHGQLPPSSHDFPPQSSPLLTDSNCST